MTEHPFYLEVKHRLGKKTLTEFIEKNKHKDIVTCIELMCGGVVLTQTLYRFVVETVEGRPLARGEYVCHKCDNRKCVNPNHLYIGTARSNVQDILDPSRERMTDRTTTITYEQACEVSERLKKGESVRTVSKCFGVSELVVLNVARGRNWKHLKVETLARSFVSFNSCREIQKIAVGYLFE